MLYDGAVTLEHNEDYGTNDGTVNLDGVPADRWNGKAIKVNIGDVEYETVSDYGDINNEDETIFMSINAPEDDDPGYIDISASSDVLTAGTHSLKLTLLAE